MTHAPTSTPAPAAPTTASAVTNPGDLWKLVKTGTIGGLIIGAIVGAAIGTITGTFSMFWSIVFWVAIWGAVYNLRNPIMEFANFLWTALLFCFVLVSEAFLIILITGHAPMDGWIAFTQTTGPEQMISQQASPVVMIWFMVAGAMVIIASKTVTAKRATFGVALLFCASLGAFVANQRYHAKLLAPHPNDEQSWEYDKQEIASQQSNQIVDEAMKKFKDDHDQEKLDKVLAEQKENLKKSRRPAETNTSNGSAPSPAPQASCPGLQVLGGGVLKLDVPASCGSTFETALVNSSVEKAFHVQFTSEQLTEPPFTTSRGTEMHYDAATQTLTVNGDLYYKHGKEDIGKQALLILRPIS